MLYCVFTKDLPKCELLIIMGTSLKVHPFASLIDRYVHNVFRYSKQLFIIYYVQRLVLLLYNFIHLEGEFSLMK